MPIKRCTTSGGGKGYKYGNSGHCYPTREGALNQMRAMFHAGYKPAGASEEQTESAAKETALTKEAEEFLSADEDKSRIQAIKFDKSSFNRKSATAWAKEHGFKADFLFYAKDDIILSQFPQKTNVEFNDIKVSEGIYLKVEGELSTQMYVESKSFDKKKAKLEEKLAKKTDRGPEDDESPPPTMAKTLTEDDAKKVAITTQRIDDTAKPQTSVMVEKTFMFDKRRFSKEGAKDWYRHYAAKKFGKFEEDGEVTLVDNGDFWVYECLPEEKGKTFTKFKTLLEHEGVTVIVGIV